METTEQIKELVRQKYGAIAEQPPGGPAEVSSCCGPSSLGPSSLGPSSLGPSSPGPETVATVPIDMTVGYDELKGYVAEADLGLGCGLPTQFA